MTPMQVNPEAEAQAPRGARTRGLVALAALGAVVLLAAGCGDGDDVVTSETTTPAGGDHIDDDHIDDDHMDDDELGTFAFGEPADVADADRMVEIEMSDELRFVPDEVEVAEGETITFRLHNAGKIPHDFTIGDAATQDEHDAEMADMDSEMMRDHGDGNAVTIAPGETEELTWHFTEVEGVLFGCHIPGHYDAGMRGTFTAG